MVNKSLRTISDSVRFSYSASLEVRTQTFLPTTCYTKYKNINAIFRRNSKLMVALSFSVYFTATRFIAGIKCRKINAGPFRT